MLKGEHKLVHARVVMTTLGDFIENELRQRHMSAREFATFIGVAHTTVGRAMYKDAPDPTLDFLVKLARATNVDLCTLVALVKPDDVKIQPDIQLIADRIARLPADKREIVDGYLRSLTLKPSE